MGDDEMELLKITPEERAERAVWTLVTDLDACYDDLAGTEWADVEIPIRPGLHIRLRPLLIQLAGHLDSLIGGAG